MMKLELRQDPIEAPEDVFERCFELELRHAITAMELVESITTRMTGFTAYGCFMTQRVVDEVEMASVTAKNHLNEMLNRLKDRNA